MAKADVAVNILIKKESWLKNPRAVNCATMWMCMQSAEEHVNNNHQLELGAYNLIMSGKPSKNLSLKRLRLRNSKESGHKIVEDRLNMFELMG